MQKELTLNPHMYLYRNPVEYTLLRRYEHQPTSVIAHLNISAGEIVSSFGYGKKVGDVINILKNKYNNMKIDDVMDFVKEMFFKNVLVEGKRDNPVVIGDSNMFLPITLQIEITRRCVLDCKHCYIKNRNLEEKINSKTFSEILDMFEPYNLPLNVQITGGETLLVEDVWELLDILEKRNKRFSFYTTGLLVDEPISKRLGNYKNLYSINISLDGNKEEHEYLRGEGIYEKTIKSIKILKKYNKYVQVGMVLRKNHIEAIRHVNDYLSQLDGVEMGIGYLIPVGNGEKMIDEVPSMKDFVDGIKLSEKLNISKSDLFKWKEDAENLEKLYMSEDGFSNMVHSLGIGGGNCGAGYVSVSIAPNGDIYPCVVLGSYEKFKIGNIFIDNIEKLFKEGSVKWAFRKTPSSETCGQCRYLPYCNKCFGYVAAFCNNPEKLFP